MPPSASKSEELTTRHTATFKSPPRPSDLSFLSLSLSSLPTTSYTQRTSSAPSQHLSHPYQTARMPVAIPTPTPLPLFPPMTRAQVEAARTSAWYPVFRRITLATTIIDLDSLGEREAFLEWMEADSIFLPEDSEDPTARSTASIPSPRPSSASSNASSSSGSSSASPSVSTAPIYRLPRLNAAIRQVITKYGGAVFPKLNWTSPKDAAFILPQTSHGPLYCTTPADIYLLLKSSDFISHDLDAGRVFVDCEDDATSDVRVELVLKRFVEISPAREVRCFVRNDILLGVTQRDVNYYEHLQVGEAQRTICDTIRAFWEDEIRGEYPGGADYVFDLHLSNDDSPPTLIDIQPYRPSTDPLLFTYPELLSILETAEQPPTDHAHRPRLPILRVIDSRSHPDANRNAPAYGSNMLPLEMVEMSEGRSMEEFREAWQGAVSAGLTD